MEELYHIGIDIHRKFLVVAVLDEEGELLEMKRIEVGAREFLKEYFSCFPEGTPVVIEATSGWEWVNDLLEECGKEVKLANPHKVKLIAEATIKTDKIDACVLAHLERTNFLPLSYIPPKQVREYRELLRHRIRLVRVKTSLKNRVHSILTRMGILHEGITDLFGKRGREFLANLELPGQYKKSIEDYLELIESLEGYIKEIEKEIKRILKGELKEEAEILMSVCGISYFSALLLSAEIGDIERFSSAKKLCSYAGLAPTTTQSGEKMYHGHLKRDSNKYIKWVLLEAVEHLIKKDKAIGYRYYKKMRSKGKNKARVMVAQKLCRSIYAMLKHREGYQELRKRMAKKIRVSP